MEQLFAVERLNREVILDLHVVRARRQVLVDDAVQLVEVLERGQAHPDHEVLVLQQIVDSVGVLWAVAALELLCDICLPRDAALAQRHGLAQAACLAAAQGERVVEARPRCEAAGDDELGDVEAVGAICGAGLVEDRLAVLDEDNAFRRLPTELAVGATARVLARVLVEVLERVVEVAGRGDCVGDAELNAARFGAVEDASHGAGRGGAVGYWAGARDAG